jgi:hypothetical protein
MGRNWMTNRPSSTPPPRPTWKVVVVQPNVGIYLIVVFDDVIQCPETLWETRVTHIALERLGA